MNLAIITVSAFGTPSLDKHGKQAIYLAIVAGKIPNRNIISGTIAERNGFEVGKSYLVSIRETEPSEEYGRQFQFNKVSECASVMDILQGSKELGEGSIYDVTAPVEVKETA